MSKRKQEKSLWLTWATTQQEVLDGWLDLVQGTPSPSRAVTWNETVKAWQNVMQETLAAQARWLRDWSGRIQVTAGSPTELRKNVQEAQHLLLSWTEAQQHLWQGWFQLIQQIGPLLEADSPVDEHLLSRLRESGQEIVNAQEEWLWRWTSNLFDREN